LFTNAVNDFLLSDHMGSKVVVVCFTSVVLLLRFLKCRSAESQSLVTHDSMLPATRGCLITLKFMQEMELTLIGKLRRRPRHEFNHSISCYEFYSFATA